MTDSDDRELALRELARLRTANARLDRGVEIFKASLQFWYAVSETLVAVLLEHQLPIQALREVIGRVEGEAATGFSQLEKQEWLALAASQLLEGLRKIDEEACRPLQEAPLQEAPLQEAPLQEERVAPAPAARSLKKRGGKKAKASA